MPIAGSGFRQIVGQSYFLSSAASRAKYRRGAVFPGKTWNEEEKQRKHHGIVCFNGAPLISLIYFRLFRTGSLHPLAFLPIIQYIMNVLEKERPRGENRVDNSTQNPSGGGGDNIRPGRDFLVD
jgi:hypothetical protein